MMNIEIRKVNEENEKWEKSVESLLGKKATFIEATSNYPHAYFAAYHEDEMVGHSIILKTNSWILDGLFVKKEFRSNGIAKKLTESRINYAKEMGASEIHFCCADENLASIKSHEKSGFKEYRKATKSESPVPGCWYIKNFKV